MCGWMGQKLLLKSRTWSFWQTGNLVGLQKTVPLLSFMAVHPLFTRWFVLAAVYTPVSIPALKRARARPYQGLTVLWKKYSGFFTWRESPSCTVVVWATTQMKGVVGFLFYCPSFPSDSDIFHLLTQSSNQPSDHQPWNIASQSTPPI